MRLIRIAVILALCLAALSAVPAAAQIELTASIDRGNCLPKDTTFTVPAGKTAYDFVALEVSGGNNCGTGAPLVERSFGISRGSNSRAGDVLTFDGKPGSKTIILSRGNTVDLATFTLSAGTYTLFVNGGRNAFVRLSYKLR